MNSHGPDLNAHEQNVLRHQDLNALLAKIDGALKQRSQTVEDISDMLGQLGDQLVKRFAFEEDGGYLADALIHAPQLVSRANALLAQHLKMCTQAENLGASLKLHKEGDADWWARTADLFRAFHSELMRHETQEKALLQEAYQQDIGATD